jgi:hypothetical protein
MRTIYELINRDKAIETKILVNNYKRKNIMTDQKTYPRLVSWSYYSASPYLKGHKEGLTEVYLDDPKG